MSGFLYFTDDTPTKDPNQLSLGLNQIKRNGEYEPLSLFEGIVKPLEKITTPKGKKTNEIPIAKLKFDIRESEDYFACTFNLFLFPDNTIDGSVKYYNPKELDKHFSGIYHKSVRGKLIICGQWRARNNAVDYFFIELS